MLHFLLGTLCSFQGKNDKKLLDTEGYHLITLSTYIALSKKPYEPLSLWVVPNYCLAHGLNILEAQNCSYNPCLCINDKGNYRPICLSNVCSKIVEMALARRLSDYLHSSHNQFGFKLDHGTELCVFTFKELLRFYVEYGSAMHVASLDASKAFDRVNRCKLLTKLENRGVAKYILRLISYDFISQHICIRWGNSCSDFFTSTNGVKQGGILSPLFFNVYMDNLSAQLNSQHIGCSTGDVVVNHMLYADDIALFSPSAKGLQKLLDMCFTYGCSHAIQFNPLKSVVMYIDSRKLGAARPMVIGSDQLNFVSYYTYLGHIISDDLSDESDMKAKARQMYARSNMLRQRFHFCSADVKNKLFSTCFNNIYMCALWVKCSKSTFHMFIVYYNNCYRILQRLPMRCSASGMFAAAMLTQAVQCLENVFTV